MNKSLRVALWVGMSCIAMGGLVAQQSLAVTTAPQPLLPGLVTMETLQTKSLSGRLFEPLLTYSVSAADKAKAQASPPPDLHLCNTLLGDVPYAVFSMGADYPIVQQGQTVGGLVVNQIGDGYIRFGNGTMLMASPCGAGDETTGAAAGAAQPAGATITGVPGVPAAAPQPGGVYISPPPAQTYATPTPYAPTLYGQPVATPPPYGIVPAFPGQTPPPTTIVPPPNQ